MSEEAIQDILEQTESDPAFQALFDLFDYGRVYYSELYRCYETSWIMVFFSNAPWGSEGRSARPLLHEK